MQNRELCFLCKKTKLKDIKRRAPISFENVTDRVKKFIQLDPSVFDLSRIDEDTEIIQTRTSNNAFYHKGCRNNFTDSNYARLGKKVQNQRLEGSLYLTPTIPHKRKKTEIGTAACLFFDSKDYKNKVAAAGEYHTGSNNPNMKLVESLTENWKQMAMQLGELNNHAKLCYRDVRSSEIYYHKVTCFMQFGNRYKSLLQKEKNASTERETILLDRYA